MYACGGGCQEESWSSLSRKSRGAWEMRARRGAATGVTPGRCRMGPGLPEAGGGESRNSTPAAAGSSNPRLRTPNPQLGAAKGVETCVFAGRATARRDALRLTPSSAHFGTASCHKSLSHNDRRFARTQFRDRLCGASDSAIPGTQYPYCQRTEAVCQCGASSVRFRQSRARACAIPEAMVV